MSLSVREARYADCNAVGALKRRNGLSAKWSIDRWVGLWQENPAMPSDQSVPMGWVLEQSNEIVGYLGNIPLNYHFRGKRLLAVAARGFAVDAAFRSHSLRLAAAFFSQKNVDVLLNTSANASAAAVFQICKAEKIPHADYDKALYWIIRPWRIASSALRKYGLNSALASLGGIAVAPIINVEARVRRRGPLNKWAECDLRTLESGSVGADFDVFWERTLKERSQCMLAERSARVLRWHFGHRGASGRQGKIVCAHRAGNIIGYVALTREDSEEIGLIRSRIVDLIAEKDAPELIDALLCAAYRQAREDGSHLLELIGFPARIRTRLEVGKAYVRPLPSWQFWYKVVAADLQSNNLRQEDAWYGNSYDGDASL